MVDGLCIVFTARMGSERLPGKAMADVGGKPLAYWIMRRLGYVGKVVLATTKERADDTLAALAQAMGIPIYRHTTQDVILLMDQALNTYYPAARFVMRGLGDCPFLAVELVELACNIIGHYGGEQMAWALAPLVLPVYGSREFPYTRQAWDRVVRDSKEREHPDLYWMQNRALFKTVYHEPPPNDYFRRYRLEVDWPEDLETVRGIAKRFPRLDRVIVPEVNRYLDSHEEVIKNWDRVERTGPTRQSYEVQRSWMTDMIGKVIIGWDDRVWQPPSDKSAPIFCRGGQCLLGFGEDGVLYTRDAMIAGDAWVTCNCGSGLRWKAKG